MEATRRITRPSLKDELFQQPYLFEFCQAIKLLETLSPDCSPLGVYSHPLKEVVSLKSRVAYAYPPSDLYSLQATYNSSQYVMEVNFMGIAGADGPLPMPYTETIIQRNQANDLGFQEFLNIFNHRLLSLLYRIRKKYWVSLETVLPENSKLAEVICAFLGLGTPAYRNRLQLPDRSLLTYGGLIWGNTKSANGFITLLKDYFQVPFDLIAFQGEWIPLETTQVTYLVDTNPWCYLGKGASLGTKAWTINRTVKLVVGPLTYNQFKNFLPEKKAYTQLKSLAHFFMGLNHHIKLNLVLKKEEVPFLTLNGQQALGWTAWLCETGFSHDDFQVVLA